MKPIRTSRRSFLKGLSVTTAGGIVLPNLLLRADDTPAGRKLGVAAIGCGGKGASDLDGLSKGNEVVALCDVDEKTLAKAAEKFPNAKLFRDFRKMLDEVKEIDAVTVSTPHHMYSPDIHPFKWRGFIEFGAGAFGDMGCHLIDAASWALDLGVPRYATATQVDEITDTAWPKGAIVKMEFPDVKGHGDI